MFLRDDDPHVALQALQTIEYLRDEAKPFAPALRELLARLSKQTRAPYDILCVTQETLHFLEGAPLYYEEFARWTPKARMEPDKSVHFEH